MTTINSAATITYLSDAIFLKTQYPCTRKITSHSQDLGVFLLEEKIKQPLRPATSDFWMPVVAKRIKQGGTPRDNWHYKAI
jgi:hypothetical protein